MKMTNQNDSNDIDSKPSIWVFILLLLLVLVLILALYFYATYNYLGMGILIFLVVLLPFILHEFESVKYGLNDLSKGFMLTLAIGMVISGTLAFFGAICEYLNDPVEKKYLLWLIPNIFGLVLLGSAGVIGYISRRRLDKLIAEYGYRAIQEQSIENDKETD